MSLPRIRVNWTIPAPIILAIAAQIGATAWWGASWITAIEKDLEKDRQAVAAQFTLTNARIEIIERSIAANAQMAERVKGVEVTVQTMKEQSQRIEDKLDTVLERRR